MFPQLGVHASLTGIASSHSTVSISSTVSYLSFWLDYEFLHEILIDFTFAYVDVCMLNCSSHIQLFVTLWTVACQAPLSMGFSRQEYWSGLPYPPPEDLPDPEIKLHLLSLLL